MGESVNETLDKSKFGGHSYNVALQQKAYDDEISRIWYTQAKSLSNTNIEDLGPVKNPAVMTPRLLFPHMELVMTTTSRIFRIQLIRIKTRF